MIPAITYIRVSTDEQNPENQLLHLEKWATERGYQILKHYIDHGVSGAMSPLDRPAFKKMLSELDILTPRPKVLLIYETSRLVRNFRELFNVLDLLEGRLGLVVVSTSEREAALQTLDITHRTFLRAVLAFVATLEREFIRQRTKTALERAKSQGKIKSILDEKPDLIPKAVEMYKNGHSLSEIAKELKISVYAVRRLLSAGGIYRPTPETCPRCFRKMIIEDRRIEGGFIKVRLYCPGCGYVEERQT
ncbi:MAG: recombinase family protein [Pyrobaculum sp.]